MTEVASKQDNLQTIDTQIVKMDKIVGDKTNDQGLNDREDEAGAATSDEQYSKFMFARKLRSTTAKVLVENINEINSGEKDLSMSTPQSKTVSA